MGERQREFNIKMALGIALAKGALDLLSASTRRLAQFQNEQLDMGAVEKDTASKADTIIAASPTHLLEGHEQVAKEGIGWPGRGPSSIRYLRRRRQAPAPAWKEIRSANSVSPWAVMRSFMGSSIDCPSMYMRIFAYKQQGARNGIGSRRRLRQPGGFRRCRIGRCRRLFQRGAGPKHGHGQRSRRRSRGCGRMGGRGIVSGGALPAGRVGPATVIWAQRRRRMRRDARLLFFQISCHWLTRQIVVEARLLLARAAAMVPGQPRARACRFRAVAG